MSADTGYTDISGYWSILRRRKLSFLLPFVLVAAVGTAIAFLLPAEFRSEATILIERQSIPTELVATTVTGYVQEQIEQIRQRISTYENLIAIGRKHDYYSRKLETNPRDTVREIAEGISVAMVNVSATDPDQRGERKATIAFTVSFTAADPTIARDITDELATRYIAEHLAVRKERAQQVSDFLGAGADTLRAELTELEAQLASFKQHEFQQLPELMNMNLKLLESTETAIATTETRIRQLGDKISQDQSELSLTPAFLGVETESGRRLQTASERLSALTAEYLQQIVRYSAKHPDVIRLSREIRVLAEQSGTGARADEILQQLATQQQKLREARQTYSDSHPAVLAAEKSVAALQRGLQSSVVGDSSEQAPDFKPDNPRYVALQAQIATTQSNLTAERENLVQLNAKAIEYRDRLFNTPIVDRDLRALTLDYDNTKQKYRDLTQKLREAQLAQQIEKSGNAERFELVNRAQVPKLPESPNRIGILALSLLLASIAGLLSTSLTEYLDKTIYGVRAVVASLGVPPLVVIPDIRQAGRASGLFSSTRNGSNTRG